MGLDQFLMGIPLKFQTADIASRDVDQMYWLVSVRSLMKRSNITRNLIINTLDIRNFLPKAH